MLMIPNIKTIPVLGLMLLAHMVTVTSHPDNSVVHKRSIGSGEDNKLVGSGGSGTAGSPFVTQNGTVTVAQTGGTATLPCVIRKHNSAVVSWIRKRDHHLLTVGGGTYSNDVRFLVRHARHVPASWPLLVHRVQRQDAGYYECQLSTHPPASILVQLKVVEAYAEVEGGPDIHIRSGSELKLICKLHLATEQPEYVFWFHGERMINFDQNRGIKVTNIGVGSGSGAGSGFSSELILKEATSVAGGNYTCSPANAKVAMVTVHVHDDAACSTANQGQKPGQEAGLIVQCPLATKDRQEVVPEKPAESSSASLCCGVPLIMFYIINCVRCYLNKIHY